MPVQNSHDSVAYIINDKVLKSVFDSELIDINDSTFISLKVIDQLVLAEGYGIKDKRVGILVRTVALN